MASLTKEELKLAIVNHGLSPPPPSARKEEFLAMYNEHIAETNDQAGEFSDDEVTLSPRKRISQSSAKSKSSSASKSPKKGVVEALKTTEETSLIAGDIDVDKIDDADLRRLLQENNVDVGPIVNSTRQFYKKKLALILRGENGTLNGTMNGTSNGTSNGEFSDTEPESEPEDDQPSGVVYPQEAAVTRSRSSGSKVVSKTENSPSEMKSGLRKRLNISDELDSSSLRHTPTPRRSIHTYKVIETTRQVVEVGTDGVEKRDITRTLTKTEDKGDLDMAASSGKSGFFSLRKIILLSLLILILIFVFVYINKTKSGMSVEKIMASVEKSLKGSTGGSGGSAPPAPQPSTDRPIDTRDLPDQLDSMA